MNDDIDTIERLNEAFSNVAYHRDVTDFTTSPRPARLGRRKRSLFVAVTATAALAVGGSVAARRGLPDATSYAKDSRSVEQAAALDDEAVTFDEYQAGFLRFSDCMERAGRPLTDVELHPSTQLYTYAYDGVDDCYERELYALDVAWQLDPGRPGFAESPDARELLEDACRTGEPVPGFPYTGDQLDELCSRLGQIEHDGG